MKQIKAEVDLMEAGVGGPLTSLSHLHIAQFHVDQKNPRVNSFAEPSLTPLEG